MKTTTTRKRPAAPPAKAAPPTPIDSAACMQALERVLRGQLDGYTRLLVVIERQCEAIRTANPQALEQAAGEQESLVRALAAIDAQRTQLLNALGFCENPARAEGRHAAGMPTPPATLGGLLEQVGADAEQRSRLMTLAADLRERVHSAKRAGGIVRDAANALARHMAGIQQTVHSALSRARVYERRGRLNPGSALPATVDMKS